MLFRGGGLWKSPPLATSLCSGWCLLPGGVGLGSSTFVAGVPQRALLAHAHRDLGVLGHLLLMKAGFVGEGDFLVPGRSHTYSWTSRNMRQSSCI